MKKKQVVLIPNGPPKHPFLSPAMRAGDYIYVSGNVGLLPGRPAHGEKNKGWMPGELISGGIEAQTRQTIENLKALLEAAGATLEDIVKVNTFLRDIDRDFHAGYSNMSVLNDTIICRISASVSPWNGGSFVSRM